MEQAVVMINQSFSLFCVSVTTKLYFVCYHFLPRFKFALYSQQCAENYSISLPNSLSTSGSYFVRYTYPDRVTKDVPAQLAMASANVLTAQSPG